MTLKIISAEDVVFEGEATAVHLPGAQGAFTVLKNHASLISTLAPGEVTFTTADGAEEHPAIQVNGGIVNVDRNVVSVCIF